MSRLARRFPPAAGKKKPRGIPGVFLFGGRNEFQRLDMSEQQAIQLAEQK